MNFIKQIAIIMGCLAIGELLVYLSGIKVPSSIIGMILLFLLLRFKWIKVDDVSGISTFLLKNMGIFFVPPCIEIMKYYGIIKLSFFPILTATIFSTLLVAFFTGLSHQFFRSRK